MGVFGSYHRCDEGCSRRPRSDLAAAEWGYCRWCRYEVEVRDGRLIKHRTCFGSGQKPTDPPQELTPEEEARLIEGKTWEGSRPLYFIMDDVRYP